MQEISLVMQCDQCGTPLHRDDARFCANCGAIITPREHKPSLSSNGDDATLSSVPPKRDLKKPLREQLARQPSALSSARKLEENLSGNIPVGDQVPEQQDRSQEEKQAQPPTLATSVVLTENAQQEKEAPERSRIEPGVSPVPDAQPASTMKTSPAETPKRELHVKVWRQPDTPAVPVNEIALPLAKTNAAQMSSSAPEIAIADNSGDTENQPTRPLGSSEMLQRPAAIPETPAPERKDSALSLEQMDTMQLAVQPQPQPISPQPQRWRPVARKSGPLMLFAIVLPILIIGSLILWIGLAQPFSVSPITQPWQSYNDPSLGMSFVYPNDWSRQVDRNKSIVQFNDSSHTAQVTVAVSNATSDSLGQFAQQQAKQFGLTTTKSAPTLSFGAATWQQIQGNTQISGANYSGRVLSTTHGNRHYVIVQLAPLDTYNDEEKVIFSPMHASWKFGF